MILLIAVLFSCTGGELLEELKSPNQNLILRVELDKTQPQDEHLGLRLLNKDGKELDYLRTSSSNVMKWAVTWYDNSSIIMDSHDVGSYAWRIDQNGRLIEFKQITDQMKDKCSEAFKAKYGSHSQH